MRITRISPAVRKENRVNIYLDNEFFCSLDIAQLSTLNLKVGKELNPADVDELKQASDFGKLYTRSLEYLARRPRSVKEMRDYLHGKTFDKKLSVKDRKTGEYKIITKQGFNENLIEPVLERLLERSYLDDKKFAESFVRSRAVYKNPSRRKLILELKKKGIDQEIIDEVIENSDDYDEKTSLKAVLLKKINKYESEEKLIAYLARQGFSFDDIKAEIANLKRDA